MNYRILAAALLLSAPAQADCLPLSSFSHECRDMVAGKIHPDIWQSGPLINILPQPHDLAAFTGGAQVLRVSPDGEIHCGKITKEQFAEAFRAPDVATAAIVALWNVGHCHFSNPSGLKVKS